MGDKGTALRAKAAEKIKQANAIVDSVGDESLTAEQVDQVKSLRTEHDALISQAEVVEGLAADSAKLNESQGRPGVVMVKHNFEDDPQRGFKKPSEFLLSVRRAGMGRADDRLRSLAVGSDEQRSDNDPLGGFFVPEAFAPGVESISPETDPTLGRVTSLPMQAPTVNINARVDKNHSSSVSGGLTVSRRNETGQFASSKMEFEQIKLTANSLVGLAYATEEILNDSPVSFAQIIANGFGDEFGSAILKEKMAGTGVGEYLGILNSPAKIEVAKEGSQTADTIVGANLVKMRSRCWNYGNAVWMANHDTLTQLISVHTSGTNSDVFMFVNGNGTDVPSTLFGRPIFFTEYCETLGDAGDIVLVDWSQYLEGTYQPMESASSIHVRFDYNETAFKFYMRNAGAPWWSSALTPVNSTSTLSPIVTLAARA